MLCPSNMFMDYIVLQLQHIQLLLKYPIRNNHYIGFVLLNFSLAQHLAEGGGGAVTSSPPPQSPFACYCVAQTWAPLPHSRVDFCSYVSTTSLIPTTRAAR